MELKNKYTVIVPTMYFHNEELERMILRYEQCDYIEEILIVNNNRNLKKNFVGNKVRTIGVGVNIYVIPAWNLGIVFSKTEKVILANDDIFLDCDFNDLMVQINDVDLKGKIIGPASTCYDKRFTNIGMQIVKSKSAMFPHGFGVFIILTKKDYQSVSIPKEMKVWYGDKLLYEKLKSYCFEGVQIKTGFAGTSRLINLLGIATKERLLYLRTKQR